MKCCSVEIRTQKVGRNCRAGVPLVSVGGEADACGLREAKRSLEERKKMRFFKRQVTNTRYGIDVRGSL